MTRATIVRAAVALLLVGMPLPLAAQGRASAPVTALSIHATRDAARPHLQAVVTPAIGALLTVTTTPFLMPASVPTITPSLTMMPSARPAPMATPTLIGPTATPTPDLWMSPAAGFVVTGDYLHLAVQFLPLPPPAAPIARVLFMGFRWVLLS